MRLTKRRPTEVEATFADTLSPSESAVLRLGLSREALRDELDQQRTRAEMAEAERDEWEAKYKEQLEGTRMVDDLRMKEIGQLTDRLRRTERDDLGTWSLPSLAAHLSVPFDEPIPDGAKVLRVSGPDRWHLAAGGRRHRGALRHVRAGRRGRQRARGGGRLMGGEGGRGPGFTPWATAQVGDYVDLDDSDAPPCCAVYPGEPYPLYCTRDEEHDGQHVATGDSIVQVTWPGAS
jgi:hypothetical protein